MSLVQWRWDEGSRDRQVRVIEILLAAVLVFSLLALVGTGPSDSEIESGRTTTQEAGE